jgi:hypothetical protein
MKNALADWIPVIRQIERIRKATVVQSKPMTANAT